MNDKQIAPTGIEPRIFLLSDLLHCISMTALVFLRGSFGFAFLRPKSVFFAFTWAFALYAVYAWIDREAWLEHRVFLHFGCATAALYWLHLGIAFNREWRGSGEHDHFAGTSWIGWLLHRFRVFKGSRHEETLYLLFEPATVLGLALLARLRANSSSFAAWLFVVAGCLWAKAALNHWFSLRQRKRQQDVFGEMDDQVEAPKAINNDTTLTRSARKPKIERLRSNPER